MCLSFVIRVPHHELAYSCLLGLGLLVTLVQLEVRGELERRGIFLIERGWETGTLIRRRVDASAGKSGGSITYF